MPTDPASSTSSSFVAISGATGLIGGALAARLRARNVRVRRLVRPGRRSPGRYRVGPDARRPRAELPRGRGRGGPSGRRADRPPLDRRAEEGHPREPRARHGARGAHDRRDSTVEGRGCCSAARRSAFYGDRGDEPLDEESAAGSDFLAAWCASGRQRPRPPSTQGCASCCCAPGSCSARKGGALERLLLPFRMGVGGPIGSGRQWMSWISLDDQVRAMEHAFATDRPARPGQSRIAEPGDERGVRRDARPRALAAGAGARARARAGAAYGEMARATILAGQRVLPKALLRSEFQFAHPTLDQALRFELEARLSKFAAPIPKRTG